MKANFIEQYLKQDDVIIDELTFTVGEEELKDVFEITVEGNKVTYRLKQYSSKRLF